MKRIRTSFIVFDKLESIEYGFKDEQTARAYIKQELEDAQGEKEDYQLIKQTTTEEDERLSF